MTPEDAGWREFAKLVPDHVLGYVNRNVAPTVVNGNRVSHHFRKDRRPTAPGPEYDLIAATI